MDASGAAYIVGQSWSTNFPTVNPFQGTRASGQDVFVAKLSPEGNSLIYATYLGGNSDDYGNGIAVDPTAAAYVTGFTLSSNFPVANPLQDAKAGEYEVFVTKFNPAGNTLSYSTYLGGRLMIMAMISR